MSCRRNLTANGISAGKGVTAFRAQQNRAPKCASFAIAPSVKSQAPPGAMLISDNLVRNICYRSEYFAFFNVQTGVAPRGFQPLINDNVRLRVHITQNNLL